MNPAPLDLVDRAIAGDFEYIFRRTGSLRDALVQKLRDDATASHGDEDVTRLVEEYVRRCEGEELQERPLHYYRLLRLLSEVRPRSGLYWLLIAFAQFGHPWSIVQDGDPADLVAFGIRGQHLKSAFMACLIAYLKPTAAPCRDDSILREYLLRFLARSVDDDHLCADATYLTLHAIASGIDVPEATLERVVSADAFVAGLDGFMRSRFERAFKEAGVRKALEVLAADGTEDTSRRVARVAAKLTERRWQLKDMTSHDAGYVLQSADGLTVGVTTQFGLSMLFEDMASAKKELGRIGRRPSPALPPRRHRRTGNT